MAPLVGFALQSGGYYKPQKGARFVRVLRAACQVYDVDPIAAASVGVHEGAGGGIGDVGTAYGPWQIHATDGRLPRFNGFPLYSQQVQSWAWSTAGISYAIRSMARGGGTMTTSARGIKGHAAVHAIVYGFERPADKPLEESRSVATYDGLAARGNGVWAEIAHLYGGPAVGAPGAGDVLPAPPPPPIKPAGLSGHWADLLWTFSHHMPDAGVHASNVGNRLARVVGFP